MRASRPLLLGKPRVPRKSNLVNIENATFHRHHPSSRPDSNPPLFPGLTFKLPFEQLSPKLHYWAVIGPSSAGKTTFLEVLREQHLCFPPTARSFPSLLDLNLAERELKWTARDRAPTDPSSAIQYVGFGGKGEALGGLGIQATYLSARYESRREPTDFSVLDYLKGNTSLNAVVKEPRRQDERDAFTQIIEIMNLRDLLELPVGNLSNGQTRRARIAKALMARPKLLLLDEPFLGIDPMTQRTLSHLFWALSRRSGPQVILALLPQDEIPKWITHILCLDPDCRVKFQGPKEIVIKHARKAMYTINTGSQKPGLWKYAEKEETPPRDETKEQTRQGTTRTRRRWDYIDQTMKDNQDRTEGEALVKMKGVQVKYGNHMVLGNWEQEVQGELKKGLWWDIKRGDRWALFGANGSGKTTVLSLICSDHPQSYSLPIELFGRSRLPTVSQPGVSVFDIQARIGHASPEISRLFPHKLTIRQAIESAWADAFLSKPFLTFERDSAVDACLRWFRRELDPNSGNKEPLDDLAQLYDNDATSDFRNSPAFHRADAYTSTEVDWADSLCMRDVSFSAQQVTLFLRAIIKKPDLVILDEAFSGMDESTRIKCMLFLAFGENIWLRPFQNRKLADRQTTRTILPKYGKVGVEGLEPRQALLCVSHKKEEVSPLVDRWICLPEANTEKCARFGKIVEGIYGRKFGENHEDWWEDVWGNLSTKWPERRKYYDVEKSALSADVNADGVHTSV